MLADDSRTLCDYCASSVNQLVLHDVDRGARQIARQRQPADALHVPEEVIFSRPMAATPAAEPMIRMEPPVPAQ
jgi:hypothetical protein